MKMVYQMAILLLVTWAHPGDSVAVKFDGIDGCKIDSVQFAFRRNGTIQMDVSEFDGTTFLRGSNFMDQSQLYLLIQQRYKQLISNTI